MNVDFCLWFFIKGLGPQKVDLFIDNKTCMQDIVCNNNDNNRRVAVQTSFNSSIQCKELKSEF